MFSLTTETSNIVQLQTQTICQFLKRIYVRVWSDCAEDPSSSKNKQFCAKEAYSAARGLSRGGFTARLLLAHALYPPVIA